MAIGFLLRGARNLARLQLPCRSTLDPPRLFQAGITNYPFPRWGDYSATSLDPTDDWSFWTVQEYAGPLIGDPEDAAFHWKTTVARTKPNP